MSDWGLDSEMVDCMSCGTVSSLDEVSDRGGRCPVCGQYNHDLDAGRHHAAFRRLHTAADPTLPPAFGEDTNVVHRMVGWDLPYVMRQRGHTPESIAQDLKRDPEGTAHSIFGSIEDNYGGIGHHFTRNPAMADYIADVKGDNHDFHVVFSGTHDPEDVNTNNDDLTGGEWPEEEETTLLPGSSVNIHQMKIRPSHSPDWTTVPMNRDSYASWDRNHTASRRLHTAADEDYRDSHQAPGPEDGAPMHDVTQGIYPASFYDEPFRYWGTDESTGDRDSWGTIHKVRGNPDARVKVHRALPLDVAKRERGIGLAAPLNTGDWVTPSYNYAHEHGMSRLEGNTPWTVVTSTVPASQLHTDGNSLAEWGYNGPPTQGYEGANAAGKRKYRQQQVRKQQINAETTKDFHHCGFCGSPSGEPCERGCWGKKKYPGERDVRGDLPGQPGVSGGGEIDYDPGALRDIRLSHRSADGIRYAQVVEADVADDLARMRLAAVNQDLVDKLHNEFHQWAVDYAGPSEDLYGDQHNRGPIGEWKNVESFLHDRYPAAHKNHDYGQEEAAWALDGHEPMPYQLENQGKEYGSDLTPYATGPEAVAQHGYDPAEIAASMVLLHNQSHPLRGNLAQEDQDRLTDIFQKRRRMQRDYDQRNARLAMAWDRWAPQVRNDFYQHVSPEGLGKLSRPCEVGGCGGGSSLGAYWIDHGEGKQSHLTFTHRPQEKRIDVNLLGTHEDFQGDGVAESLMRRLHEDHPGMTINPGSMTGQGRGFHDRMLEKEPDARNVVTAGLHGDLPEGLTFRHHPDGFDPFPAFDPDDPVPPPGHKWVQFQEDLDYDEDEDDDSVPFYLAAPDGDSWHVRGADSGFRYSDDELKIHNRLPPGVRPEMGIDSWPTVSAHDGDRTAGYLQWISNGTNHGEIRNMQVHPDYRRRGIGLALFDQASKVEPRLHHSENLTEDGRGWSQYEQARNARLAAVTQDLIDRLSGEFHDWWHGNGGRDPKDFIEELRPRGLTSEQESHLLRGPVGHWPNIENFLKDKYPAAHRGLIMGHEEARTLLDWDRMYPHEEPGGHQRYETGPEAHAQHGYDPKEIAAGMLLLHNKSDRLRGDLSHEDQTRLNDIAQKRFQMQRDYEQRTARLAMPRQDAYDAGTLKNDFGGKPDQTPPFPGPWFHGSPDKLEVGDILNPGANKNYEYDGDRAPRQNWVFMDLDSRRAKMWAGEAARQRQMPHDTPTYVYRVEPLDEGPWPWNEYPDMGYASPRARVVERRHVDEMGDWDQHPQFGPRRKRDISKLMERLRAHQPKTAMPWYHRTDDELNPGDHLLPYNQVHPDHQEVGDESWNPNKAYVYYGEEDDSSDHAPYAGYGQHIYEIEPHDDPQRDYGDGNHSSHMTDGGTVIKRLPDEDPYSFGEEPQWADPIAHKYASRTAMPAPLPQGVYFRYHPELVWSPGVTAHAPGGKQVGSLEWYDDDHVMVDLGTRRPGEIDRIQVPEDQRGQSIATSMFDFAKQHEPRLHHSDILTEDGRGWSEYEQSRDKSPMPKRFAMPTVYHGTDPESAQSILQNGFSPGGWGDKSFFSTEPQDAASYGESLLSVDIPDDEWERTERHPWMHHETAEIDPHRLQELGIKPRLLDEVPHRPLTGPPVWPKVYRKNPDQTWQEGRPVDQVARQIDTDDDLTQMRGVPDWPKGTFDAGTGTYWDVDFGDGPIPVHQRDLYT